MLAARVVSGGGPEDLSVGADTLAGGIAAADRSGYVDPGYAMDSAWRGVLPPATGFVHLEDIPVRVLLDLAQRGVALAREHGSPPGSPVSLLDQDVISVDSGGQTVASRCDVYSL